MSNIEVNEYVRTKGGLIDIYKEDDGNCMFAGCKKRTYWKLDIVNHSKNIIDLIEVGDYVNGHRVCRIDNNTIIWLETETQFHCGIYEKDIKSIVTWEMMKSVEYRVE